MLAGGWLDLVVLKFKSGSLAHDSISVMNSQAAVTPARIVAIIVQAVSPIIKITARGGGVPPFRELFSGNFRAHVNIPEMDEEKYRKGRGEVFSGISCCPMLSMSEHYTCVVACDFRIERAQGVVQSACPCVTSHK